jgi:hypothetical protein
MRIISMHKVTPAMEAGELPSQELIQGMGRLMGETRKSGALIDGAGLRPSATRLRLRHSRGEIALEKGPYAGENELVSGIAMLKVRDLDEAIAWASRYARAIGDVELELGPVTEPWDLGMIPKPAEAPLRCLLLHKADAASEAGKPLGKAAAARLAEMMDEMQKAGVLLLAERLRPSRHGVRIQVAGKKASFVDGPFAESKELIAGFVLMNAPSIEAMREWNLRFAEIIGDVEMEVRVLYEPGEDVAAEAP